MLTYIGRYARDLETYVILALQTCATVARTLVQRCHGLVDAVTWHRCQARFQDQTQAIIHEDILRLKSKDGAKV